MTYFVRPLLKYSSDGVLSWSTYEINEEGQILAFKTAQQLECGAWQWIEQKLIPDVIHAYCTEMRENITFYCVQQRLIRTGYSKLLGKFVTRAPERATVVGPNILWQRAAEVRRDINILAEEVDWPAFNARRLDYKMTESQDVEMALLEKPFVSLEKAFELLQPTHLAWVEVEPVSPLSHQVLYLWHHGESWHYKMNLFGQVLFGEVTKSASIKFLDDKIVSDEKGLFALDADERLNAASLYLQVTPKQQLIIKTIVRNISAMTEETGYKREDWYLADKSLREHHSQLGLAMIGGDKEGFEGQYYSFITYYRDLFRLKGLNSFIDFASFYGDDTVLIKDKTNFSSIYELLQLVVIVSLRYIGVSQPLPFSRAPKIFQQVLDAPILDEVDLVHDLTQEEIARMIELDSEPAPPAPSFAKPQEHTSSLPAVFTQFVHYRQWRATAADEYLTTTSFFGFFKMNWGFSRTSKLAASDWIMNVLSQKLTFTDEGFSQHAKALQQGRLGKIYHQLLQELGQDWATQFKEQPPMFTQ